MVNGYVKYGKSAVYIMERRGGGAQNWWLSLYFIIDVNHRIVRPSVFV